MRATHTGSKAWALSVVPHFSLSHRVSLSSRGMIFTRARVSLALLSIPKEKRGLLVIWEKSRKNHAKNRAIQRHTGNIVPLTKKRLRAPFVPRKNMIRSRVLQVPGYYEEKKLKWNCSMATSGGLSVGRKPSGFPSSQQQTVFKRFILEFVQSLGKDDRKAFRYWCKGLIAEKELDINVDDDGDILKLIELLQDHNLLLFDDMSLLKKFLSVVKRIDLLGKLEKAELSIEVGKILERYKMVQGSDAGDFYAEVVELLVSRISQMLEQVRRICSDERGLLYLDGVIREHLSSACTWSRVIAVLVILAELSAEVDEDVQTTIDLLAESMYKLGGMVSVYDSS